MLDPCGVRRNKLMRVKVCIDKCSKIRNTHLQETKMFERSSIFNSPKEHIAHSKNHLQHTASPNFTSPNPLSISVSGENLLLANPIENNMIIS